MGWGGWSRRHRAFRDRGGRCPTACPRPSLILQPVTDRKLFEILVREHSAMVRAFLLSAVRDPATADDLLQEAFLVAWKNLDRYDRSLPFGPWVRGIAGKLVLSHRRKIGRSKMFYCDDESLGFLENHSDELLQQTGSEFEDKLEALTRCMEELSGPQRETIKLHYEEGLLCKEIAPRIGLGVEAVKKHLQRGRAALARCIERRMQAEVA